MRGANEFKTRRARSLRKIPTDAEDALWYQLRARRLNGFEFVRQEPLGPYTVDFICRERRLVIEADGGQHADNARDKVRDKWLADYHYRVLRFWNHEILENVAGVLEVIATALAEAPLTRIALARSDLSPQAGRGEKEYHLASSSRVPATRLPSWSGRGL